MRRFLTKNSSQTLKLGEDFSKELRGGDIVLLTGDLGAGKTTFVQGLAKGLGIKEKVLSPTFVLVRNHDVEHENIKTLNHIDLYRIEKPQEIENLGIGEFFSSEDSVTVIEWAEKLLNFTPKKCYKISLVYMGDEQREIIIEKLT